MTHQKVEFIAVTMTHQKVEFIEVTVDKAQLCQARHHAHALLINLPGFPNSRT